MSLENVAITLSAIRSRAKRAARDYSDFGKAVELEEIANMACEALCEVLRAKESVRPWWTRWFK